MWRFHGCEGFGRAEKAGCPGLNTSTTFFFVLALQVVVPRSSYFYIDNTLWQCSSFCAECSRTEDKVISSPCSWQNDKSGRPSRPIRFRGSAAFSAPGSCLDLKSYGPENSETRKSTADPTWCEVDARHWMPTSICTRVFPRDSPCSWRWPMTRTACSGLGCFGMVKTLGLWLVYEWFMTGLWLVYDWFMTFEHFGKLHKIVPFCDVKPCGLHQLDSISDRIGRKRRISSRTMFSWPYLICSICMQLLEQLEASKMEKCSCLSRKVAEQISGHRRKELFAHLRLCMLLYTSEVLQWRRGKGRARLSGGTPKFLEFSAVFVSGSLLKHPEILTAWVLWHIVTVPPTRKGSNSTAGNWQWNVWNIWI